jgi:hypothetical protein
MPPQQFQRLLEFLSQGFYFGAHLKIPGDLLIARF